MEHMKNAIIIVVKCKMIQLRRDDFLTLQITVTVIMFILNNSLKEKYNVKKKIKTFFKDKSFLKKS